MIFSSRRSFLFKNRMTEEFWNQGYVIIVLKSALLSSIRFWKKKSQKTRHELLDYSICELCSFRKSSRLLYASGFCRPGLSCGNFVRIYAPWFRTRTHMGCFHNVNSQVDK